MGSYTVSRSTVIGAPADRVHALIEDLRAWRSWSPWEGLDAELERTYSGSERGEGARYAWQGNKKAGQGSMHVISSTPAEVVVDVSFVKPFRSSSTSTFTLTEAGGRTTVGWQMTGQQNALMSVLGKVWSMDRLMGPDFEKGLAQLKALAERG
ncbi:SRPBCC family protein [Luteococcus peritonei]|uniref:SRPBCC family protein n=1 Tax=Luteococcus peritonei TaxID=88874 RepID=A0ABW4RTZ3_9ACTN